MPAHYLTPKQLCDRWGGAVTVGTLANWRASSPAKGPSFVKFGERVAYPVDAVEAYERETAVTHD